MTGNSRPHRWAQVLKIAMGMLVLAALLGACASVPLAPPAEDAAAKTFEVPPGKALIYVYRDTTFGAAIKFDISINGVPAGKSARYTYFLIETPPGPVRIKAESENTAELTVNAEAGKIYWVDQGVRMGVLFARVALEEDPEGEGRKAVSQCQLVRRIQL